MSKNGKKRRAKRRKPNTKTQDEEVEREAPLPNLYDLLNEYLDSESKTEINELSESGI
jgi:hypothetical protein